MHELRAKGVALRATEQPVDTSTAASKAFLDMLGVFAEFEINLRRERQLEGIGAAKKRGVYIGRTPGIDADGSGARVTKRSSVPPLVPSSSALVGPAVIAVLDRKSQAMRLCDVAR